MSTISGVSTTDTYSYPADSNRLTNIAFSTGGLRELTYDAAGNVTFDNRNGPGYGYNYDAAGRMSSFAINGVIQSEYEYNALGQQVIRRLPQTGEVIHSVHDALGNRIAEYDYDETTGTSTLIREYIWAAGVNVAVVEAGQVYFVRTDHIGRPVFATDTGGTKAWETSYLPFGGVQTSTGPNSNLRFPGQWFQSETGLHQNWMRDYDPTTGRYIQADPLGLVDGASIYGYALQNPGRYVDPRGEEGESAMEIMRREFDNMREANWIGADKYFHCKANCEATQCGYEGGARRLSNVREFTDWIRKPRQSYADSHLDQTANRAGRNGANNISEVSCAAICSQFRPDGLPVQY